MKNIKPLSNKILIQRSKAQTSKGGILLPDSAQEKPKEGVVVATGPGKVNDDGVVETLSVKKGDRVLFTAYSGTEVKLTESDEQYMILAEDDILAVISN